MRILLTNDDGIASPALGQLKRTLSAFGRGITIAPDRNQSATSQSLTLHRPLRIQEVGEDTHSVDGTPTDCVLVAFHGQLGEKPALVHVRLKTTLPEGDPTLDTLCGVYRGPTGSSARPGTCSASSSRAIPTWPAS